MDSLQKPFLGIGICVKGQAFPSRETEGVSRRSSDSVYLASSSSMAGFRFRGMGRGAPVTSNEWWMCQGLKTTSFLTHSAGQLGAEPRPRWIAVMFCLGEVAGFTHWHLNSKIPKCTIGTPSDCFSLLLGSDRSSTHLSAIGDVFKDQVG